MSISTPLLKDITKIKKKEIGKFTKRQIVFFIIAGVVGIPVFFFLRPLIGSSTALMIMVTIMMPFFIMAIYEKNGVPAEVIIQRKIHFMYKQKKIRPYKIENSDTRKMEIAEIKKEIRELERKGNGGKESKSTQKRKKENKKISPDTPRLDKDKTDRRVRKPVGGRKQTPAGIKKETKAARK